MKLEPMPEGSIALSPHHWMKWIVDSDETRIGAFIYHRKPDGSWCGGALKWAGEPMSELDQPRWTLVSMHPFHIEPSVKCGSCPDDGISHGWIRDGRWKAANPMPEWAR